MAIILDSLRVSARIAGLLPSGPWHLSSPRRLVLAYSRGRHRRPTREQKRTGPLSALCCLCVASTMFYGTKVVTACELSLQGLPLQGGKSVAMFAVGFGRKGTSLVVQRLRLYASNAGDTGLIPGWGTKIPHAV